MIGRDLMTGASAPTRPGAAIVPGQPETLPDHLVRLPGGEWALWQWVAVRGAGFAASEASMLVAPASAQRADAVLDLEADVERARDDAIALLRRDPGSGAGEGSRRAVIRQLRKVDFAERMASRPPASGLSRLAELCGRLDAERDAYRGAFARETARVADDLCALARQDRFREAILWQNRAAVHTGVDQLERRHREGRSRNTRQRDYEQMLASYLLRYTLKNDTIGFFGPVGWATLSADQLGVAVRPGSQLLAERNVYFEGWCIDALVARLAGDPRLEPWFHPRRSYTVHVEGSTLFPAKEPPIALSAGDAAVLRMCDGENTVRRIAAAVTADPSTGLRTDEDVLARLRELRDRGWITHTLAVPMEQRADETLARLLRRIDDDEVREQALGSLHELQRARARVACAAGDVQQLDSALAELEQTFTRLTGAAPTRSGGKTYGARTLVYEDCRRDVDVTIGRDVIEALGPPLELVLASARWFTFDTARRYAAAFDRMYREIAQAGATDTIGLASFLDRAFSFVIGNKTGPSVDARAEFQERWARVLDLPDDGHRVEYSSHELRPLVRSTFDAPGPGWPFARYHSPDLMIAARSADDIRRGDYLLVLGELHAGSNTLGCPVFLAQHPNGDELRLAADRDLPDPRLEAIIPKSFWPGQSARVLPSLVSPKDYRLELCPDPSGAAPSHVLPVASFVVAARGDRLVVRTLDGRLEFELIAVMAQLLTWLVLSHFTMLSPRPHRPRVTVDRLVIMRETWSVPASEIAFAWERDEAGRFLAARRWASRRGLPRHVFVRAPVEKKPFHVDFDSPICVNILAKVVRRTAEGESPASPLTFTEMLPQADETWLVDADGHHYTSELRLVAVDLTSPAR